MRSELDRFDRSQPALIITYGNTTRKVRPLDRDVLMLGRASGCDVQVKSPDIFPVHLLIVRVLDGWRLRDCTGRSGTQLNGRPVQDEMARAAILAALRVVDLVVIFSEDTPEELIRALEPDLLLKGADYAGSEIPGGAFVKANGGSVEFLPLLEGYSTSRTVARLHDEAN